MLIISKLLAKFQKVANLRGGKILYIPLAQNVPCSQKEYFANNILHPQKPTRKSKPPVIIQCNRVWKRKYILSSSADSNSS